jgi:hypothetical protein
VAGVLRLQARNEALVLAQGDELHLRSNDSLPRVVHLRDALASAGLALQVEAQLGELRIGEAFSAVFG